MNVNEVIANKASELLGGQVGQGRLVHPNDDVNMSQSSNDTIPTAMHIAVAQLLSRDLIPALEEMTQALKLKSAGFSHIIKIGRTHGMDATPLTLKQEFSAYVMMLIKAKSRVANTFPNLYQLPQGGTAVGNNLIFYGFMYNLKFIILFN